MENAALEVIRPEQPPTGPALDAYREIILIDVTDQATSELAVGYIGKIRTAIKNIETWFSPMLTDAKASVAAAKKVEDGIKKKYADTVAIFVAAASDKQLEINRFLTTERDRVQKETLAAQEKAAREKREREKELLDSAKVLEDLGSTTAAESLRQEAERVIEAPAFVPTVDKTIRSAGGVAAGGATMSQSVKVTYQVTDARAFIKYLAENNSAAAFIEFPVAKLNAWGKSQGIKAGEVPGLAVKEEVVTAVRGTK